MKHIRSMVTSNDQSFFEIQDGDIYWTNGILVIKNDSSLLGSIEEDIPAQSDYRYGFNFEKGTKSNYGLIIESCERKNLVLKPVIDSGEIDGIPLEETAISGQLFTDPDCLDFPIPSGSIGLGFGSIGFIVNGWLHPKFDICRANEKLD